MSQPLQQARRGPRGFTLIEVLAAVMLTSMVIGGATAFHLALSRSILAGTALTADTRRAAAVLDRVARDLQGAYLLSKPDEVDPLDHPWLFLAEGRLSASGSDRIKFTTLHRAVGLGGGPRTDQATVAYVLRHAEGLDPEATRGFELVRWIAPGIPDELDRSFPLGQDSGAIVVADGVASFGVRFMNESFDWVEEWDSTTLAHSSELPLLAEIELALVDESAKPDAFSDVLSSRHRKRVLLLQRPLEYDQLLLAGSSYGQEEEGEDTDNCNGWVTWGECLARQAPGLVESFGAEFARVFNPKRFDCFDPTWNLRGQDYGKLDVHPLCRK